MASTSSSLLLLRFAIFALLSTGVLALLSNDYYDQTVVTCSVKDAAGHLCLLQAIARWDLDPWTESVAEFPTNLTLRVHNQHLMSLLDFGECRLAEIPSVLAHLKRSLAGESPVATALAEQQEDEPDNFFEDYQSYESIMMRLVRYAEIYDTRVKLIMSIGQSVEGRNIPVIHISAPNDDPAALPIAVRRTIWLSAGQHAREWIATASVLFAAESLIAGYGSSPAITEVLRHFVFVVAPLVNPDGYEYSRQHNRFWRKNRRPSINGVSGVDLNRNWPDHWGEVGGSTFKGSDDYVGPWAGSEPEVYHVASYIMTLSNRAAGIDFHSYGQLVLRNYGWTLAVTDQESLLKKLGDAASAAMSGVGGASYRSLTSATFYRTSGSMDDWMFEKAGMPGFTIELRDRGSYGFLLPPSEIKATGREVLAGLVGLATTIHAELGPVDVDAISRMANMGDSFGSLASPFGARARPPMAPARIGRQGILSILPANEMLSTNIQWHPTNRAFLSHLSQPLDVALDGRLLASRA